MGKRVAEAAMAVASFAAASSPEAVCAFAESYGWPVILKPAMGSSSAGVVRAAAVFTEQVLRALTDRPTAFHHELFFDERTGECAFPEVGARVGGAEVPLVWRELHGYDLMEAALRIQPGLAVPDPPSALDLELGGWLLISTSARRPCRIAQVTPMVGRGPGPYAESLLSVGQVLPATDSYYEHVGGRCRFRGTSSEAVERAVTETATALRSALTRPRDVMRSGCR
jgi:biotin carboxylase